MKSGGILAAARGALAGGLATVPMSAAMLAAQKAGWFRFQPPEAITAKALEAIGSGGVDESTKKAFSVVDHVAFGAATGALFGLLHRKLELPVAASTQGVFFGILVWLVSYEGWVPAFHVMPPVERDEPGRPAAMVIAHVVYGAVLGGIVGDRCNRKPSTARRGRSAPASLPWEGEP